MHTILLAANSSTSPSNLEANLNSSREHKVVSESNSLLQFPSNRLDQQQNNYTGVFHHNFIKDINKLRYMTFTQTWNHFPGKLQTYSNMALIRSLACG